jgi:hypothetical protein
MSDVRSIIKDLVSYSVPLNFTTIRVTSDKTKTLFEAVDEDRRVIMKATSKEPVAEFDGVFGMPNLKILKGYIEAFDKMIDASDKNAKKVSIDIQKNNTDNPNLPTDIQFKIPSVSTAIYRLQLMNLPSQLSLKSTPSWDAEIVQPSRSKISEFAAFASILSDIEKNFSVKTNNEELLKFNIGNENSSTDKVSFVFADGVKKTVNPQLFWRCNDFLSIMNLSSAAATVVKISNLGVIQISVDTGLINYDFLLPGAKD